MSTAVVVPIRPTPPAWNVFAEGLIRRRPVHARYHGTSRLVCPHVLGWRNGSPKVLSYQIWPTPAELPDRPTQRWRLMFLDEVDGATLSDETWQTADNYAGGGTGIDIIELAVEIPASTTK